MKAMPLRSTLVVLLTAATVLFAVGVLVERSVTDTLSGAALPCFGGAARMSALPFALRAALKAPRAGSRRVCSSSERR